MYVGFDWDSWYVRTTSSASSPRKKRLKPIVKRKTPTRSDGCR
jgi:hypothetical protein